MTSKKTVRAKSRIKSGGVLIAFSSLLLASAVVRAGGEAADALGTETGSAGALSDVKKPPECALDSGLEQVLAAVQTREQQLNEREADIDTRLRALNLIDRDVTGKLAELRAAEEKLRETIALADEAAEGDIARLTKVYETMKPKQAARLFEVMDPKFAAGFLGRMRPEAAADIMAGLSAEAAHTFSVVLAGRNADVPVE